jgi:hypothetical protein
MTTRPLASLLLLAIALPGCDKVTALLGQGEGEAKSEAKAETEKAEAKVESKGDAVAKADAKVEAKVDAPAPAAAAPAPAAPAAEPVAAAAAPEAAAAAPPPCIVGRWKAIEYLAEVRRAIAKDPTLSKMKRSSSGGLLGYDVGPLTDGKGTVSAKAEALRYVFNGKVEGFNVTLTFTLDGEAEAEYTLVGDDTIVVAKPGKDTFVAKANAKVEGMPKLAKSVRADHDFDGTFTYECTDKTLKVWRGKKGGEPLDFTRE